MQQPSQTRTMLLEQVGFARLTFALFRQRFTGTLSLEQPGHSLRTIWFRGGMPVYTDWFSPDDVLGEVLVQRGAVRPPAVDTALIQMATEGGLLGHNLLAMGEIDLPGLTEGLRQQCQRKLVKVFAMQAGEVVVVAEEHGVGLQGELVGQVDVLSLLRQGVMAHYDEARARREMAGALGGPLLAVPAFERYRDRFGFREAELALVDAIVQGTTFDSLVVPGADSRRAAQVTFVLFACQMLVPPADALAHLQAHGAAIPRFVEQAPTPVPLGVSRPAGPPPAPAPRPSQPPAPSAAPRAAPPPPPPRVAPPAAATAPMAAPRPAGPPPPPASARPATPPAPPARSTTAPPTPATPAAAAAAATAAASASETSTVATLGAFATRAGAVDEAAFLERLVDFEVKIKTEAHAFDLFGLPLDADRKAVRAVWTELSTRYHPDALEAKGLGHHRARVEKVFAALSEANSVLSNKEQREELKALLEAGGTGKAGETAATVVRRALEAETLAREADRALKTNNFAKALEGFQQSLDLHADQPDVVVSAAWCRFNLDGRSEQAATTARKAIKEIVDKNPNLAKGHYFLGMILVAIGQDKLSIPSFEAAKEHDPRLVDAERQLRAVRIRLQQSGQAAAPVVNKPGVKPAPAEAGGAFAGLRGMFGGKKS